MNKNSLLRLGHLAAVLIGIYIVGRETGFTERLTVDGIREWMLAAGQLGFGVFVVVFLSLIHI